MHFNLSPQEVDLMTVEDFGYFCACVDKLVSENNNDLKPGEFRVEV